MEIFKLPYVTEKETEDIYLEKKDIGIGTYSFVTEYITDSNFYDNQYGFTFNIICKVDKDYYKTSFGGNLQDWDLILDADDDLLFEKITKTKFKKQKLDTIDKILDELVRITED